MDDLVDLNILQTWADETVAWVMRTATDSSTLIQAAVGVAAIIAAFVIAPLTRGYLNAAIRRMGLSDPMLRWINVAERLLGPVLAMLFLWLAMSILPGVSPGTGTNLIAIMANLMTAWVVIRIAANLISNPLASRGLSLLAWGIAALNISGLLTPTIEILDSVAIDMGGARVSPLTVVQVMLSLGVMLWAATSLSGFLERRIGHVSELTPSLQVLIGKLLKVTLLTLAVVIALTSVGIDLSAFALLSGAIGVGLGFGLQKVVSNLVSGFIILLDKSVKPGDTIELGETFGWITALGARFVSIVTRDGKEYLIPNEDFITQRVVNWSFTSELVRLEIPFGVSYNSDPHELRRIACEAASKPERVSSEPQPVCHLVAFGDSSLDFVLRFWIHDPRDGVTNVRGAVMLAIWDAFKEHGVEIPFPHRQLLLDQSAVEGLAGAARNSAPRD